MQQCDKITSYGQCPKEALPGSSRCEDHPHGRPRNNSEYAIVGQYRLAKRYFDDSPERHADVEQLKSLRGELTALRSMLEKRWSLIDSDAELIAAMPSIQSCAGQIEKLVGTCHAMDVKLGNLLSKAALVQLAQEIIGIIDSNIRDLIGETLTEEAADLLIEKVANELVAAVAEQENPDDKRKR